jgi:DNA processing protein
MSETSTSAWYALAKTPGIGPARLRRVAEELTQRRLGVEELVGAPLRVLLEMGLGEKLAPLAAESLAEPPPVPSLPDGLNLLTPDDELYPRRRLEESAPPLPAVLYVSGSTSLFNTPSIAVVGSRHPHPEARDAADAVARRAATSGKVIVSGLAQGIDEVGHTAALDCGGNTIAVLAEGIPQSLRARQLVEQFPSEVLVVSQFEPDEVWTPARAMQRNSTVAALADAVVIAASDISGGSWEMGRLCLKHGKRLFVLDFGPDVAPGNRRLIASGGIPLSPSDAAEALDAALGDEGVDSAKAPVQQTLFD